MPTVSSLANALSSYGTLVQVGNGASPEVFSTIAGVLDITGPAGTVDEVETTSHSTGSPHKTHAPTLIDDGQLQFDVNYQPQHVTHLDTAPTGANPPGLGYLFLQRKTVNFRIVAPDPSATTRQFAAFVKQFSEKYPVNGLMRRQVSIRFASAPVTL